jgi:hypothetical protein
MKKILGWLMNNIAPTVGRAFFRLIMLTVKIRHINRKTVEWQFANRDKSGIYCFWHGNLLVPYHYHRRKGIYIVISQHRDGEVISSIVERGGYKPVRGSSTRGGWRAMKELLAVVEKGAIIAFTPDGPRGPLHEFKDGPVYLAQATGTPLYLMGVGFSNCWTLKDWSRLKVPKPFSTVCVHYTKPYEFPRELTEEQFEQWNEKLAGELNEADAEAERVAKLKEWRE